MHKLGPWQISYKIAATTTNDWNSEFASVLYRDNKALQFFIWNTYICYIVASGEAVLQNMILKALNDWPRFISECLDV